MKDEYTIEEIVNAIGIIHNNVALGSNQFFGFLDRWDVPYLPHYKSTDPNSKVPFGMLLQIKMDIDSAQGATGNPNVRSDVNIMQHISRQLGKLLDAK